MITKNIAAQARLAKRKKGFTLTEIAIVLGIIGLILGAIWSAASGVYASQNASAFTQQMTQYVAAVRSACNNSCSTLPTVTVSIPNVNLSQITPAAPTPGVNAAGDLLINYQMPAAMSKYSNAVAQGLAAAANATGSTFTYSGGGATAPSPTCTGVNNGGTPKCTITTANYNSSYISGGASNTCPIANGGAPSGTCSLVYSGPILAGQTYVFGFAQSF